MSTDSKFINGLIVKAPNEKAPEYVKAKLSIRREELIAASKAWTTSTAVACTLQMRSTRCKWPVTSTPAARKA